MKKKLFITGSYLICLALLFGYISYSAYRIKIEGIVIFPQTHAILGSMSLEADETTIAPGTSTQGAIFKVSNDSCDLDLEYIVSVETSGRLPLQFKLDNSVIKLEIGQTQGAFTTIYKLTGSALYINTHNIEVGWNNMAINSCSAELRREVDKVTFKANIYALPDINKEKIDITVTRFN